MLDMCVPDSGLACIAASAACQAWCTWFLWPKEPAVEVKAYS